MEFEIASVFAKSEGENSAIRVPIPEALLGDKLTAFAPNTTGIPYGLKKEVEIIKQLFDVGHLFDFIENLEPVISVFVQFAKTELNYRNLVDATLQDILIDIFETALHIGTRGQVGRGNFVELQKGILNIRNYIFSERFHLERAMVLASKAAYIAILIGTETNDIQRFSNPIEVVDWLVEQPFETRLNKLKKTNPEAFFYWYKAIALVKNSQPSIFDKAIG